jgi:hypothetical protein
MIAYFKWLFSKEPKSKPVQVDYGKLLEPLTPSIATFIEKQTEELYKELYGSPKNHKEWADSFNIKGKIKRVLKR